MWKGANPVRKALRKLIAISLAAAATAAMAAGTPKEAGEIACRTDIKADGFKMGGITAQRIGD